jgi:hypothetical protein
MAAGPLESGRPDRRAGRPDLNPPARDWGADVVRVDPRREKSVMPHDRDADDQYLHPDKSPVRDTSA